MVRIKYIVRYLYPAFCRRTEEDRNNNNNKIIQDVIATNLPFVEKCVWQEEQCKKVCFSISLRFAFDEQKSEVGKAE